MTCWLSIEVKLSSEIKQVQSNELTNQSIGEYCIKFTLLLLRPLGFTLDKYIVSESRVESEKIGTFLISSSTRL